MIYEVVLLLLGAFAIVAPGIATLATAVTVGWLLVGGGAFGLLALIRAGKSARASGGT